MYLCKSSYSETAMLDRYSYNFSLEVRTPDSSISGTHTDPGIFGFEKDVFIYQYPIQEGSDATINSAVTVSSSERNSVSNVGKISLSVDAAIYGYVIQVYDGYDNDAGHPCGDYRFHLDDPACNTPAPNLASPGLQISLKGMDGFAFEILSLDHAYGDNLIGRVWDNSGNSGWVHCVYGSTVQINDLKPVMFVPFKNFTNYNNIDWSNIRALAFEFNSTVASVDVILGPFQLMTYAANKTSKSNQPVGVSSKADFSISIDPDLFYSFNLARVIQQIQLNVTFEDILPSELSFNSPNPFVVVDQNLRTIDVANLEIDSKSSKFSLTFNNSQRIEVSYSTLTNPIFDFCRKTVCNNVTLTVTTFDKTMVTTSNAQRSSCYDLIGVPKLETNYIQCPSTLQNNIEIVGNVCNVGNGLATDVIFTHTSLGSLSNCIPSIVSGMCNGNDCRSNLRNIMVGECVNVSVNFDCSSFQSDCLVNTFSSSFSVSESCANSSSSSSCSFTTSPSVNVSVVESLLNTVPARINEILRWNIEARNNGPQTVKSFTLQATYPQYTFPTNLTLMNWSCDINRVCAYTGSSLASSQSFNVQFDVTVIPTMPIGTTEVCNTVTMTSLPNQPNCFSQADTSSCAPVNPGTPDLVIEKSAFASQYTFTIDYQNNGTTDIKNLEFQEILQVGWSLNEDLSTVGWTCGDTLCTFSMPTLNMNTAGTLLFVVDVLESSQTAQDGTKTCWKNTVTSTFDDELYDSSPLNNQATTTIGSSCQSCCDTAPCLINKCEIICPPAQVIAPCPDVQCNCDIPEFYCPPCTTDTPTCSCNNCSK